MQTKRKLEDLSNSELVESILKSGKTKIKNPRLKNADFHKVMINHELNGVKQVETEEQLITMLKSIDDEFCEALEDHVICSLQEMPLEVNQDRVTMTKDQLMQCVTHKFNGEVWMFGNVINTCEHLLAVKFRDEFDRTIGFFCNGSHDPCDSELFGVIKKIVDGKVVYEVISRADED